MCIACIAAACVVLHHSTPPGQSPAWLGAAAWPPVGWAPTRPTRLRRRGCWPPLPHHPGRASSLCPTLLHRLFSSLPMPRALFPFHCCTHCPTITTNLSTRRPTPPCPASLCHCSTPLTTTSACSSPAQSQSLPLPLLLLLLCIISKLLAICMAPRPSRSTHRCASDTCFQEYVWEEMHYVVKQADRKSVV